MKTDRISIKGHKLKTQWRGSAGTYAHGRCECGGWQFQGWSERMWAVRSAHQSHLRSIIMSSEAPK